MLMNQSASNSNGNGNGTHIQRMVSAERELREQAEAETYWELQRAKSLGAELQVMRESLDSEEAYWALRRQQSFGEALRRDWEEVGESGAADSNGIEAATVVQPITSAETQHCLAPPPPAEQALTHVQQQIARLNDELGISQVGYVLHPGGLATLPPPPTDSAQGMSVPPASHSRAPAPRRVAQYHQFAREMQMEEQYWVQESALRRQRSLTDLAREEEENELARGGGPLDWSVPSYLSTDVTDAAGQYLQAGRRAAEQAMSVGRSVAKAAVGVTSDARGDLANAMTKASAHINDVFTAPPALDDEDAYWQGRR